jgi:hypothetical protein
MAGNTPTSKAFDLFVESLYRDLPPSVDDPKDWINTKHFVIRGIGTSVDGAISHWRDEATRIGLFSTLAEHSPDQMFWRVRPELDTGFDPESGRLERLWVIYCRITLPNCGPA